MSVPGNQNAKRGREWRDALRKAMAQYEDGDCERGQALFKVGTKVVKMALDGDMDAIREVGNRLDGKPVQTQEIDVKIDARLVVQSYVGRLGWEGARELLSVAAPNLVPMLEQLQANRLPETVDSEAVEISE